MDDPVRQEFIPLIAVFTQSFNLRTDASIADRMAGPLPAE